MPPPADYIITEADAVAEKILSVTGEATIEVSSGEVNYTNQLPISIDSDSSIYNSIGYKTGYRLNSSGVEKQITESYYDTAVCTTGYIPCNLGDTIYISGMVINPSDIQAGAYNIAVYDASFNKVEYTNWTYIVGASNVVKDSNGYIASFAIGGVFTSSSIQYIRLCAKNITADSIVTVNEEIKDGGSTVLEKRQRAPFNLAFLSDLHWNDDDKSRMISAAQGLKAISKTATLDAVVFGGDYIANWSSISTEDAKEDIANCRKVFADAVDVPTLWLRGNHDCNPYPDVRLTKAEVFGRIGRAQNTESGYVSNWNDPYGGYGYMDFENAKIRVIAVNTSDNDEFGMATLSGTYSALLDAYHITGTQLQWIADYALDFSNKDNPSDWGIVFVSHVNIYNENSWYNTHSYTDANGSSWTCNVVNLADLVKAYVNKTTFSVTVNGSKVEKDFSSEADVAKVLCFISGHGHALNSITYNGFTFIQCPNVCNNGEKVSSDGTTYTKGKAGTVEETSFTILTIDSAGEKVYAWIYGVGYDREIVC